MGEGGEVTDNYHMERAKSRLHNGTTNEVARAQAEATLALAYEQQTANLIALQAFYLAEGTGPSQSSLDEIRERLGLS
jgi:hypothetical protein